MRERRVVRNPVLGLPSASLLTELPDEARFALAAVLRDIGREASLRAERDWLRHKAPMAAYWKAVGVYARHIARAALSTPTTSELEESAHA